MLEHNPSSLCNIFRLENEAEGNMCSLRHWTYWAYDLSIITLQVCY